MALLPLGKLRLTEVGGFRTRRTVVEQLGMTRDEQDRGEPRRDDMHPAGLEVTQLELVELAGVGHGYQPNPERELRCMDISQYVP